MSYVYKSDILWTFLCIVQIGNLFEIKENVATFESKLGVFI